MLANAPVTAGGPIRAELHGLRQPADVALLRIESCPSGRMRLAIAACHVEPGPRSIEAAVRCEERDPDRRGRAGRAERAVVTPLRFEIE